MSKTNRALSQPVKKLLRGVGVKTVTYSEFASKVNSGTAVVTNIEEAINCMNYKAFYEATTNTIAVDDDSWDTTEDINEMVLHELIHWARHNECKRPSELSLQTEECIAQIGMFKLTLVLGLNPAVYADKALDYIKQFPLACLDKVEFESDKVVERLVRTIGMTKVA